MNIKKILMKDNEITLNTINIRLNKLIALIAIQNKDANEQIRILRILDYKVSEISDYTGIPKRTIDFKIAELKKKGKIK